MSSRNSSRRRQRSFDMEMLETRKLAATIGFGQVDTSPNDFGSAAEVSTVRAGVDATAQIDRSGGLQAGRDATAQVDGGGGLQAGRDATAQVDGGGGLEGSVHATAQMDGGGGSGAQRLSPPSGHHHPNDNVFPDESHTGSLDPRSVDAAMQGDIWSTALND